MATVTDFMIGTSVFLTRTLSGMILSSLWLAILAAGGYAVAVFGFGVSSATVLATATAVATSAVAWPLLLLGIGAIATISLGYAALSALYDNFVANLEEPAEDARPRTMWRHKYYMSVSESLVLSQGDGWFFTTFIVISPIALGTSALWGLSVASPALYAAHFGFAAHLAAAFGVATLGPIALGVIACAVVIPLATRWIAQSKSIASVDEEVGNRDASAHSKPERNYDPQQYQLPRSNQAFLYRLFHSCTEAGESFEAELESRTRAYDDRHGTKTLAHARGDKEIEVEVDRSPRRKR